MNKRLAKKAAFREYVEVLGAAVAAALFLRLFVLAAYRIPTESMSPTLLPGDFVFAYRLSYGFEIPFSGGARLGATAPERGDVVVFRDPRNDRVTLVKRVVALAGDAVAIRNRRLFVNDKEAPVDVAPGVAEGSAAKRETLGASSHLVLDASGDDGGSFGPSVVPPGHIFVLGDNRGVSEDSRTIGAVPERNLEGRVAWIWMSLDWSAGGSVGGSTQAARLPAVRWARIFSQIP